MKMILLAGVLLAVLAGIVLASQLGLTGNSIANPRPQDLPKDFYEVADGVRSGKIQVINVGEEYYTKPEFYPTFSQGSTGPRGEHWGVLGYGAYPSDIIVHSPKNREVVIGTIIHTSWMVETYQGLKLESDHNPESFDVEIQPEEILLGPAYPSFEKGWAQKAIVRVTVKNPPPGEYVIGINPSSPSNDLSKKVPPDKKYYEAGGFGVGRPLVKIVVVI